MAEVQSLDQFRQKHAALELRQNPSISEVVPLWSPSDDGDDDGDDAA